MFVFIIGISQFSHIRQKYQIRAYALIVFIQKEIDRSRIFVMHTLYSIRCAIIHALEYTH